VTSLTLCGPAFSLVSGIAVTVRSEVRFTKDVDLAIVVLRSGRRIGGLNPHLP